MTAKHISECGPLQLVAKDVDMLKEQHSEMHRKIDQIWTMALTTLASVITTILVAAIGYMLQR